MQNDRFLGRALEMECEGSPQRDIKEEAGEVQWWTGAGGRAGRGGGELGLSGHSEAAVAASRDGDYRVAVIVAGSTCLRASGAPAGGGGAHPPGPAQERAAVTAPEPKEAETKRAVRGLRAVPRGPAIPSVLEASHVAAEPSEGLPLGACACFATSDLRATEAPRDAGAPAAASSAPARSRRTKPPPPHVRRRKEETACALHRSSSSSSSSSSSRRHGEEASRDPTRSRCRAGGERPICGALPCECARRNRRDAALAVTRKDTETHKHNNKAHDSFVDSTAREEDIVTVRAASWLSRPQGEEEDMARNVRRVRLFA
ncbi:unnamed protein product [Lampetra fluviatilis]